MPCRLRIWMMLTLCLGVVNGWAQGDNVGMGGLDEGVASILEKLLAAITFTLSPASFS